MIPNNSLIIAVDFDGTIVEDKYPKVGKPMIFAFETLKKLQSEGHRLILWTYRSGERLEEAVAFCKENGIEYYEEKYSRKINANLFIDDRNIGGFLGWTAIYKLILNHEPPQRKRKGFFSFFK